MTASQPFTASNLFLVTFKMFKYCWIWEKGKGSNFAFEVKCMKRHEKFLYFTNKKTYNPNQRRTPYGTVKMEKGAILESGDGCQDCIEKQVNC